MESRGTIYIIKLVGVLGKYCELHFWNQKEYSVCKHFSFREYENLIPLGERDVRRHQLPDVELEKKALDEWGYKRSMTVYLLSPADHLLSVTQTLAKGVVKVAPGDKVGNIMVMDYEYLDWYINSEEERL